MTPASPNQLDKRLKPWKPTRTKRGRQAASQARAKVSRAHEAIVNCMHLFAWRLIQNCQTHFDSILGDVTDQLPPGTSKEACERLAFGPVAKFAATLDSTLQDFEGRIQRKADRAKAAIVERAMRRLSNVAKNVTFQLYEENAIATIRYARKIARFTKSVTTTKLLVLLLSRESHAVSFVDIAEELWKTAELSPRILDRIRARKLDLERELTAQLGLPPREVPLDDPDSAKNQSWITSDRKGRYSLNQQVLTWIEQGSRTGDKARVCRKDDVGGLVVDPKTISSRKSDLDPLDDEAESECTAHDVNGMLSRTSRTTMTPPRPLPSMTSPVRPKASGVMGLHKYVSQKVGMSARSETFNPPPKS